MVICCNRDGLLDILERVFNNRAAFTFTNDHPDRWVLMRELHRGIEGGEIEIHLAAILWLKLTRFQLERDQALQVPIVKQQVNEKFWFIDHHAEPATNKGKRADRKSTRLNSSHANISYA